jgi:hypothetical protein
MRAALNGAVTWGLIERNAAEHVSVPRPKRFDPKVLDLSGPIRK